VVQERVGRAFAAQDGSAAPHGRPSAVRLRTRCLACWSQTAGQMISRRCCRRSCSKAYGLVRGRISRVRRQGLEPRTRGLRGQSSPVRSTTTLPATLQVSRAPGRAPRVSSNSTYWTTPWTLGPLWTPAAGRVGPLAYHRHAPSVRLPITASSWPDGCGLGGSPPAVVPADLTYRFNKQP
jgi:hypothetical protein